MTHDGRMARGEEKLSKGLTDSETEYFLKHSKPAEPVKKAGRPKKESKQDE